ncbi:MAG TPA: hypothetical protein ENG00_01445, partial [Candidatus Aenigmarchaeota archaeon]|nr:hypothetical protein [Candidatus Aenigmarchaeota archaeon]
MGVSSGSVAIYKPDQQKINTNPSDFRGCWMVSLRRFPVLSCFLVFAISIAFPVSALHLYPSEPEPNVTGVLRTDVRYESGHVIIKYINPSYPEINSNSYVYIPAIVDGESNIVVQLGSGLNQIGPAKIYQEWVGDRFEKTSETAIKWGKIITLLVVVGTGEYAYAAAM